MAIEQPLPGEMAGRHIEKTYTGDLSLAAVDERWLDWIARSSLDQLSSLSRVYSSSLSSRRRQKSVAFQTLVRKLRLLRVEMDLRSSMPVPVITIEGAPDSAGVVYFIAAGSMVKIGFTTNLPGRLATLETGSSLPLAVIHQEPGTQADERCYHRRFARLRERGEWFRHEGELADYIASLPK